MRKPWVCPERWLVWLTAGKPGIDFSIASPATGGRGLTIKSDPGAIVKWDHATMAWLNLGFKSPWLH